MSDEELKRLLDANAAEIRSHFETVAQRIESGTDNVVRRFDGLENRFDGLESRSDSFGNRFDGLENRFDGLENRFDGLESRFDSLENRFEVLEDRSDALENRFKGLESKFDAVATDMRRHFDVTAESFKHQVQLIAEQVSLVDERLIREAGDIRKEMRAGFGETQAMIKFSHDELHRRVLSLEESLADLQARVERLESSTH